MALAARRDQLRITIKWQGNKDSNLGMLESKSSALTNLAIPLHNWCVCRINYVRQILFYLRQQVGQWMLA